MNSAYEFGKPASAEVTRDYGKSRYEGKREALTQSLSGALDDWKAKPSKEWFAPTETRPVSPPPWPGSSVKGQSVQWPASSLGGNSVTELARPGVGLGSDWKSPLGKPKEISLGARPLNVWGGERPAGASPDVRGSWPSSGDARPVPTVFPSKPWPGTSPSSGWGTPFRPELAVPRPTEQAGSLTSALFTAIFGEWTDPASRPAEGRAPTSGTTIRGWSAHELDGQAERRMAFEQRAAQRFINEFPRIRGLQTWEWKSTSIEKKVEALAECKNRYCEQFGLDDVVLEVDFSLPKGKYGYCQPVGSGHRVVLGGWVLQDSTPHEPVETLLHELRHVYQSQYVSEAAKHDRLGLRDFDAMTAQQWQAALKAYSQRTAAYVNSAVELDADRHAKDLLNKLYLR